MGDVLQRIRELTVQGGDGSYDEKQRAPIKQEIQQLKEQLVQIGNSAFDGRYIFGGDKTTNPPFVKNTDGKVEYKGTDNALIREFSQGVTMGVGISGDNFNNLLVDSDSNVINKIIDKLSNNESPTDLLNEFDNAFDEVLNLRSEVGAKSKRLDTMKEKNEEETYNMTELLSKTSDIDVAEKVMQYKLAENVYMASLQTGAKIIQPSLLDYLR
jgi:flagellar hook-associated protein 3 FlgL